LKILQKQAEKNLKKRRLFVNMLAAITFGQLQSCAYPTFNFEVFSA
jgi:hypothetical protein